MYKDKQIEYQRYDNDAAKLLLEKDNICCTSVPLGSDSMAPIVRTPYQLYENSIRTLVNSTHHVLELGAGAGRHTLALAQTQAHVMATDLSPNALKLLEQRMLNAGAAVKTHIADIENLPFEDSSFDVIACAGSLSYGDPVLVDREIRRVLRPNGILICVDSLNHNPIYRFNRWVHFLRGRRTKSTLDRIPDIERIEQLTSGFKYIEIQYVGGVSFIMPLVAYCVGQERAKKISDFIDRVCKIERSAFKFVLVAKDFQPY